MQQESLSRQITVLIVTRTDLEGEKLYQKTVESLQEQELGEWKLAVRKAEESALEQVLELDTSEVLTVISAGESYAPGTLARALSCLNRYADRTEMVLLENKNKKTVSRHAEEPVDELYSLTQLGELMQLPGCPSGILFRRNALKKCSQSSNLLNWEEQIYAMMEKQEFLAYARGARFFARSPFLDDGCFQEQWADKDWYLETVRDLLKLLQDTQERGEPSLILQARILYQLKIQWQENLQHNDRRALDETAFREYCQLCRQLLQGVSLEILFYEKAAHPSRQLNIYVKSIFAQLKKEGRELFLADSAKGEASGEEFPLLPVILQLLEYDRGKLRMDLELDAWQLLGAQQLQVFLNQQQISYQTCKRICEVRAFGHAFPKYAFSLEIDPGNLDSKRNLLTFCLKSSRERRPLKLTAFQYQSRISNLVEHSYWCFADYMVSFAGKKTEKDGICIERAGRGKRIAREIHLLAAMFSGPHASRRMLVQRLFYWAAYPWYVHRNIWLTFDKLYKGGDCGEYFYRYLCTRKKSGITPVYVLKKSAPEAKRLQEEGYRPCWYGSQRQKLSFLYANMIFATHSSVHGFNGFNKWEIRYLQDRLRAVNTCIQHGLSVQDLTYDSNRIVNNNKRYYCASPSEIRNLSAPAYDYPSRTLVLTGIPRYDGLIDRKKKQILITPTWRSYIAMPSAMGNARPYNPEFSKTVYFRIFEELISDSRLSAAALETGYEILYLLHPILSAQKEDFHPGSQVRILKATESNYEQLLTESALMVTDYSGVQFDFAYMRKPILYFHPPALPPHYEGGGFDYEKQGFGPIYQEIDDLVQGLCEAMRSGCRLTEEARRRMDDFFAFSDRENCQRIYEDARALQEEERKKCFRSDRK